MGLRRMLAIQTNTIDQIEAMITISNDNNLYFTFHSVRLIIFIKHQAPILIAKCFHRFSSTLT